MRSLVIPGVLGVCSFPFALLAQPANDSCLSPQEISGLGQFAWDSTGATTDGTDHALCNSSGSSSIFNDVWFVWTAPSNGPFVAQTCGLTSIDSRVAVYDGDCLSEPVACNDDACGLQSRARFTGVAGRRYLVRVGSFGATTTGTGSLEFASAIIAGPIDHPTSGHQYYLLGASGIANARALAQSLGGALATINDADENEFVRAQVLGFDGADRRGWLGFSDENSEGSFVWDSGQGVSYTNWNAGEPNNSGGTEHYTEMLGSNGEWNDVGPNHTPTAFALVEVEDTTPACPADLDDDGVFANGASPDGAVTIEDLLYFLGAFDVGDISVDLDNGSGTGTRDDAVTIDDLIYFLEHFELGC